MFVNGWLGDDDDGGDVCDGGVCVCCVFVWGVIDVW